MIREYDGTGIGLWFVPFGLLIVILLIIIFVSGIKEEKMWNNGKCACGGSWVYEQAVGHYSNTGYIYHCDTCGRTEEFMKRR